MSNQSDVYDVEEKSKFFEVDFPVTPAFIIAEIFLKRLAGLL